jgi:hypothetical protein
VGKPEVDKLCDNHWEYIKNVLLKGKNCSYPNAPLQKEESDLLKLIEFHYKTAMAHGFKHGVQWAEASKQ